MYHFILLPVCCQITVGSLACLSLAALCAGGEAGQQPCVAPLTASPLSGAPLIPLLVQASRLGGLPIPSS